MGPRICSFDAHHLLHANLTPSFGPLRRRAKFLTFASIFSPPQPEEEVEDQATAKKSFAVATGELFLGLASRLIKSRNKGSSLVGDSGLIAMFVNSSGKVYVEERIGAVVEDEIDPDVVWEQRMEDVEAERNRFRRVVTTPSFSFSAAGFLFPYHLGVAQFLIQNGYIKETTLLAGSSAGAIVCDVIASGASIEEALTATKILAEDCRNRGTAFRWQKTKRKR